MKKSTIIVLAFTVGVAVVSSLSAHAQPAPSDLPWDSTTAHASATPTVSQSTAGCTNTKPRGPQTYKIIINGCEVWCYTGLLGQAGNAPGCNDPANLHFDRSGQRDDQYDRRDAPTDYVPPPPPPAATVFVAARVFCPSPFTAWAFGVYTLGCPGGGYGYYRPYYGRSYGFRPLYANHFGGYGWRRGR